jgi:hypothetical protein
MGLSFLEGLALLFRIPCPLDKLKLMRGKNI